MYFTSGIIFLFILEWGTNIMYGKLSFNGTDERVKNIAISILDKFEEYLLEKDIDIPNVDKEDEDVEDTAILYGSDYFHLQDCIIDIIVKGLSK